jgi:hypothetical protein
MNFQTTTINFNLFLRLIGYNEVDNTLYLLSKSYDVFLTTDSYSTFVDKMIQYNSESYVASTDCIVQCFMIVEDVVLLPPMLFIDLLYGFYKIQQLCDLNAPNNSRVMTQYEILQLSWSAISFCEYGGGVIDFTKLISICDTYYDITSLHYDFIVWQTLQLYPYTTQKFTLSEFHDTLCNLDIVASRRLPYGLNNTLMNFGCYRNIHGVYIQLP